MLEDVGCDVMTVASGNDALEKLPKREPALRFWAIRSHAPQHDRLKPVADRCRVLERTWQAATKSKRLQRSCGRELVVVGDRRTALARSILTPSRDDRALLGVGGSERPWRRATGGNCSRRIVGRNLHWTAFVRHDGAAENYASEKQRDHRQNHDAVASWRWTKPAKLLVQKFLVTSIHCYRSLSNARKRPAHYFLLSAMR